MIDNRLLKNPRVLIVKPSALGDIVHTFPVVRAIKRALPHAAVDWVVAEQYAELLRLSPHVDETHVFRRGRWARWWKAETWRELGSFLRRLRSGEYGAVVDLQGLLRSGLVTRAARSPVKVGFSYAREGASFFYNVKAPPIHGGAHAVERYLSALKPLGIEADTVEYGLVIPEREALWAEMKTPRQPFVAVNPNARWPSKLWPAERFGEVARELNRRAGLAVVVVGGPDDAGRGAVVARAVGAAAVDLTGKGGLVHLAAVLKRAALLVTNDSGPMHLAVAVGTPTVAVFGPTHPALTGPYGGSSAVARREVECAPCFSRRCPRGHECMTGVTSGEVVETCLRLLAPARAEGAARG